MKEYIVPMDEEAFYGHKDVAVELIRCKDCIHHWKRNGTCDAWFKCTPDNGHCYMGKKNEDR